MPLVPIISLSLILWWIALTFLTIRDYSQRIRSLQSQTGVPSEELPPVPRWPSWRECLARPVLLILIPGMIPLYVLLVLFIWPCFPLHRIYFPRGYTKGL